MTWYDQAACRGMGVDLFYAARPSREVVDLCAGCPVQPQCLEAVIAEETANGIPSYREVFGYRGGRTPLERVAIYRQSAPPPVERPAIGNNPECGTTAGKDVHHKRGEITCRACREAINERVRQRKAAKLKEVAA